MPDTVCQQQQQNTVVPPLHPMRAVTSISSDSDMVNAHASDVSPSVLVVQQQPELSGSALRMSWNCPDPASNHYDSDGRGLEAVGTPPSGDRTGAAWDAGSASNLLQPKDALLSCGHPRRARSLKAQTLTP